jgi:hypothetical protein
MLSKQKHDARGNNPPPTLILGKRSLILEREFFSKTEYHFGKAKLVS